MPRDRDVQMIDSDASDSDASDSDASDSDASNDDDRGDTTDRPLNRMELIEFHFLCNRYGIPFDRLIGTPSQITCKLCRSEHTLCRCSDKLESKYRTIGRFTIRCNYCKKINKIFRKNIKNNQIKCIDCKKILIRYCCWKCNVVSEKTDIIHSDKLNWCLINGNEQLIELKSTMDINDNDVQCVYCMCELKNNLNIRLPCGEIMHNDCYQQIISDGGYKCPICYRSIICTKKIYEKIRNEINHTMMPFELQKKVSIRCNDCQLQMIADYNIVAIKCTECHGYNTYEID